MTYLVTTLGLGALLMVSVGAWRVAGAAPRAARLYTGQVQSMLIDHCEVAPGTCTGALVLAPAGGPEVALAIPAGTLIQRGAQRVHLEELGLGNYVTVQAVPLAGTPGPEVRDGGSQVGTNLGERAPTLGEATEQ
jgi:hypothetical protein